MSLTRKVKQLSQNPAEQFIKVKGGGKQGWFEYYVPPKEGEEKGTNIKKDFTGKGFFVLDANLQTAGGWNDKKKFKLIGNEVRIIGDDGKGANGIITVIAYPQDRNKDKWQVAKGTWKNIKETVEDQEGGYIRSIYAMDEDGKLINIHLHGSSTSSFINDIEDRKNNPTNDDGVPKLHRYWIRVKEEWESKTYGGQTDYLVPHFEWGDKVTDEEYAKAEQLDIKLQKYLDEYLERGEIVPSKNDDEIEIPTGTEKEASFESKNWREYREYEDQKYLGELSIGEILTLYKQEEERGKTEGNLWECLSHAKYEYDQLRKNNGEAWKAIADNSSKRTMGDYSLKELQDKLALFVGSPDLKTRSHKMRLPLEVAVETREAEAGPELVDGKAEVVKEDECPF